MADYTIDGVDYTIDDSLDLPSTVAKIRASNQHFRQAAQTGNSFASAYGENLAGAGLAAADFAASIPGMVAGVGAGLGALATGEPIESAKNVGRETGAWFNPLTHIDALKPYRETGAYQGAMRPFEMVPEGIGLLGKAAGEAIGDEQLGQEFQQAGEFGTDILAGAAMGRGAIGSGLKYRAKQEAKAKAHMEDALKEAEALQQQLLHEQALKANEMQTQPDMFEPQAGPPTSAEVGQGMIPPGGERTPFQPDLFDRGAPTPQEMALSRRGGGEIPFEPGVSMLEAVGPDATSPRIGPEGAGGPYARGHGYTPDPLLEAATGDPRVFSNKQQPYSAVSTKEPTARPASTPTEGLQYPTPGFLQDAIDKIRGVPSQVEVNTSQGPLNRGKFGQAGAVDFSGFMREALDTTRVDEQKDRQFQEQASPGFKVRTPELVDFHRIDPNAPKSLPGWAKKQYGGVTIENSRAKALAEFIKEAKARGISLSPEQLKAIWLKNNEPKAAPIAHPDAPVIKAAAGIKGLEQIQRQYVDRRSLDEIKAQLTTITKDTLADKAGLNTVGKMLAGRFIAKDNPLLSWVSSQTHWTKNEAIQAANDKLHGANRNLPSPGTFNYEWKVLPQRSRVAVTDMVVALRNSEVKLDERGIQQKAMEVLGRQLSPKELKALLDRDRIMGEVLADVNKVRAAEGKDAIGQLPHYGFPSVFDGPFKVKFVNKKNGETVKVEAFYLKPNEVKMQKIAGPDIRVEMVPDSGLRGDVNWQQFEWILRHLNKELRDPAAKAITEGLRRQGFAAHGLKRMGALGSKGTEGGVVGMKGYEEISERYIRQAYDYIAARKLDAIYRDVNEMKEANHLPFTKAYALEAIDVARGKSNETFDAFSRAISSFVSGAVEISTAGKVVLPQRFTRDLLKQSNKVMTTLLLGFFHPIQIGAQFLQAPTYMPSKLLAMAGEQGRNPALVAKVVTKALGEFTKWNESKDAQKLQAIGAFEAVFKYDWSTYAGDSNLRFKQTMASHLSGLSTLAALEAHAVRRPAAHMFLEMLRELGYENIAKDKNEIYYVAKEMTDQYMVTNKFFEKPHAFNRTGLVGQAIGPLQNFSTTWLGMLREYLKLSSQGVRELSISKQLPLGSFLAANLLTAGMLGIVGVKEWDMLATFINKHTDYNVITGTEWIMSKFASTKMRFGLLSDAIGVHVGASLNAPTLSGGFAPGLQLIGNVANAGYQGLKSTGLFGESNKPTNTDMREAAKGITPRFSPIPGLNWGDIEKHYTHPGTPYQEKSGQAGPYTRTPKDEAARRLGTYTNEEAQVKGEYYAAKKHMDTRQKMFTNAMNHAVDVILSDPQAYKNLPGVWKNLAEQGFSGQDIQAGLVNEIKSQLIQNNYRAMGKGQSTRQQQLIMLLQKLQHHD